MTNSKSGIGWSLLFFYFTFHILWCFDLISLVILLCFRYYDFRLAASSYFDFNVVMVWLVCGVVSSAKMMIETGEGWFWVDLGTKSKETKHFWVKSPIKCGLDWKKSWERIELCNIQMFRDRFVIILLLMWNCRHSLSFFYLLHSSPFDKVKRT